MNCLFCNLDTNYSGQCSTCGMTLGDYSVKATETATMVEHSELVVPKELTRDMRERS